MIGRERCAPVLATTVKPRRARHHVLGQAVARGIEVFEIVAIADPVQVARGPPLAIELVDQRLEMAAKTLGASAFGTFMQVTLPLASSGILVGSILCFCRSLGEFGATITFVGNIASETRTLPLAMYSLMQQPDTEAAVWRLIILSLSVAFFALWFAQWFNRYQKNKRGR